MVRVPGFHPGWKWKWSRSVVSNSFQAHGQTIAYQAPPYMRFSRQEYWSGLPFPGRERRFCFKTAHCCLSEITWAWCNSASMLLFCYNDILYFFSIKVCISFVRFIILDIIANDIFKLHYLRDCIIVVESLSRVRLFVTPWTVAHQSPLSMGFPKQEY